MPSILVMERPENWPLEIPGAEVVLARTYLTDPSWSQRRGLKVFNVCRSYRYQSVGLWGANTTSEPRGEREVAASGSSGRFEGSFRRQVGGGGYPDGWNQARTKGIRALINRGLPRLG